MRKCGDQKKTNKRDCSHGKLDVHAVQLGPRHGALGSGAGGWQAALGLRERKASRWNTSPAQFQEACGRCSPPAREPKPKQDTQVLWGLEDKPGRTGRPTGLGGSTAQSLALRPYLLVAVGPSVHSRRQRACREAAGKTGGHLQTPERIRELSYKAEASCLRGVAHLS